MTKIYLIRHGQTKWNLEMKYQGHADIELTEQGTTQADKLAARFAGHQLTAIYSSDLSRAYKTADAIAKYHLLQVIAMPELREINFGDWEGLTYNGINEKWPSFMDQLYTHPGQLIIPGGETFHQLKQRATDALKRIINNHSNGEIAVVSHGGTIRTILCAALNMHLDYVWSIRQDNTAVNIIEYVDDKTIIALINDTHHLKSE